MNPIYWFRKFIVKELIAALRQNAWQSRFELRDILREDASLNRNDDRLPPSIRHNSSHLQRKLE